MAKDDRVLRRGIWKKKGSRRVRVRGRKREDRDTSNAGQSSHHLSRSTIRI